MLLIRGGGADPRNWDRPLTLWTTTIVWALSAFIAPSCSDQNEAITAGTAELFVSDANYLLQEQGNNPVAVPADIFVRGDTLLIADIMQGDVKIFDRAGQLIQVIGRKGSGPGEFRSPLAVNVLNDGSIVVFDMARKLITEFDNNGQYQHSWRPKNAAFGDFRVAFGRFLLPGVMESPAASEVGVYAYTRDGRAAGSLPLRFSLHNPYQRPMAPVLMAVSDSDIIVGRRDSRTLYRVNAKLSIIDSIQINSLPEKQVDWPKLRFRNRAIMTEWSNQQTWTDRIFNLGNGEVLVRIRIHRKQPDERVLVYVLCKFGFEEQYQSPPTELQIVAATERAAYSLALTTEGEVRIGRQQIVDMFNSRGPEIASELPQIEN